MASEGTKNRSDADHCFVCGPMNPIGLKLRFSVQGNQSTGKFISTREHAGFDGVTHGGIIFSVLDDAMANWFFLQGARGYTARSEIRYREPMPIGATATIDCEVVARKGRLVKLKARAINLQSGNVIAECDGSFILKEFGQLPKKWR